jgi:tRNA uridine 5-carbamoylmethylation protein Kti12
METVINTDIKLALDFVQYTNRNIFLTGKAGTGKTTFLHDIKKSLPKRMIVLAPTGVAAINAGGVTIHSFFQLPLHPYVPSLYITNNLSGDHAEQQWSDIYKMSREKIKIIKSLDLLVIDEISMVRSDTLDAVDYLLRRYNDRYKPFGGVQLLMIGDLQQLAPVVKADDWEILKKYYSTGYFFGSKALHSTSYVTIELKHVYRQSDQSFIELLNKVRDNQIDTSVLNELNKRYDPSFGEDSDEGYITLTTHNYQAQAINDSKLEKLPGKAEMFKATIKDEFPDYSYPTASELLLKTGAQIMFVKNDPSGEKLFFNGKIGKIESLDNDLIEVKCPGDEFSIMVEKVEWQNMKYSLDEETKEIGETVVGTFTQFPLKLAWAITIHKSQGLTFEKAIIDASAAFAHGQVYVALSRCRTLSGIVLSTQVSTKSIVSDSQISGFVHETEQNQPDNNQLTESKKAYRKMLLTELFEFNHLLRNLYYCKKLTNEHRDSIIGNFPEIIDNTINSVNANLVEVSKKFYPQLMYLINSETADEYDGRLQERVIKASEFFTEKLNETMTEIMSGSTVETDNRTVRKAFLDVFDKNKRGDNS